LLIADWNLATIIFCTWRSDRPISIAAGSRSYGLFVGAVIAAGSRSYGVSVGTVGAASSREMTNTSLLMT